jgi:hypothetical protein
MTWQLDLDRLEICHCGRLICDTPDCDVLRKLADGTFYDHARTEGPDITPAKYAEWQALQARRTIGAVA